MPDGLHDPANGVRLVPGREAHGDRRPGRPPRPSEVDGIELQMTERRTERCADEGHGRPFRSAVAGRYGSPLRVTSISGRTLGGGPVNARETCRPAADEPVARLLCGVAGTEALARRPRPRSSGDRAPV